MGHSLNVPSLDVKELKSIESDWCDICDIIVFNHVFENLDLCMPITHILAA